MFDGFPDEDDFRAAWDAVKIERNVGYSLFTFGESDLPYYLVLSPAEEGQPVTVTRGEVKITRPLIITADNAQPELRDFFDSADDEDWARVLLARTARFSHLRLQNQKSARESAVGSVQEAVSRLQRQLDDADEDRVAILSAPFRFAGLAVMRYATDRMISSAPGNLTELREKGLLP